VYISQLVVWPSLFLGLESFFANFLKRKESSHESESQIVEKDLFKFWKKTLQKSLPNHPFSAWNKINPEKHIIWTNTSNVLQSQQKIAQFVWKFWYKEYKLMDMLLDLVFKDICWVCYHTFFVIWGVIWLVHPIPNDSRVFESFCESMIKSESSLSPAKITKRVESKS
jgi:hypothetical protein